ncbi:YfgM family protein [Catenovulum sediminis]|uniref:YfgM family protein n=1 Tax=Catenovulum sediminis TaxID=1740262 RepID=UPI00117C01E5|nr:tetratricopeptide repeat protein [Catenovulum sediminis]
MEIYSTEEQQVEAIKKFWSKYGTAIIVGSVLGLGGIYGYKVFQNKQIEKLEAQSLAYSKIESNEQLDKKAAESYIQENTDSGFAVLAAFKLAKSFVAEQQYQQAADQLKWVTKNTSDLALQDLATVRLARVLIAFEKSEEALALVGQPNTEAFTAQFAEIRGDIHLQKNDKDKARTAYQLAADNGGLTANPALKMKLDNLAVSNGTVAL